MKRIFELIGRKLVVDELRVSDELLSLLSAGEFIAMLPAYSKDEMGAVLNVAEVLFRYGCKELCCIGAYSYEIENELDFLLEHRGLTDVVTTAFTNEHEAAEYFLFAAGGARGTLLIALVGQHETISDELSRLGVET